MRAIAFIIALSLIGCSSITIWTSGWNGFEDSAPFTTEIQITDSSYAEYLPNWGGCLTSNTGTCFISNAKHSGDTLFVYSLKYQPSIADSDFYVFRPFIKMAYLTKGKKLYPIYDCHPRRFHHSPSYLEEPVIYDSSAVKSFTVNWEGWQGNNAYIDFNGGFHSKGKFVEMREFVEGNQRGCDSIEWTMFYPREVIDDTNYVTSQKTDYLGPLKNNGQ
ncbi:MAG: hypothetical protein GQ574_16310 [Crocinitomix sp.]|nr:hypothetical protein [Crocinitomix sp.]